jgi:hypothetical protein
MEVQLDAAAKEGGAGALRAPPRDTPRRVRLNMTRVAVGAKVRKPYP